MISYRDGHPLIVCDGCLRPMRTGEQGWQVELGIFDSRPARAAKNKPDDPLPPTVLQARQDAHACPDCATPYGRSLTEMSA